MSTATQPQYINVGFRYDGSFPLDFLECDEQVAATGTGSGNCIITSPRGHVRLRPGDFISRREDGSLYTTSSQQLGPRRSGAGSSSPAPASQPPSSGAVEGTRDGGTCSHCPCVHEKGAACCECEFAPAGVAEGAE